jgi:hypothetical protein
MGEMWRAKHPRDVPGRGNGEAKTGADLLFFYPMHGLTLDSRCLLPFSCYVCVIVLCIFCFVICDYQYIYYIYIYYIIIPLFEFYIHG